MANYSYHPKIPLEKRLWKRVDKSAGPDACWPWTGCRNPQGYGYIGDGNGKVTRPHRVAYELANGSIPAGLLVCHHCDNPPCCNPKHLFIGTHQDNADDCLRKGRNRNVPMPGEENPQAKLTEGDVKKILALGGTMSNRAIARHLGVTPSLIGYVLKRKIWKHISP